jgi:DNA-binding SARP family transcriptional activator
MRTICRRWQTTAVIVGLAALPLAAGPVVASHAAANSGLHRLSPAVVAPNRRAEALAARAAVPRLLASTRPAAAGLICRAAQAGAGLGLFVAGALGGAGSVELLRRRRGRKCSPAASATGLGGAPQWPPAPVLTAAQDLPCPLTAAPSSALVIGVLGTFTINGAPATLKPAQGQLLLSLALNKHEGMPSARMCDLLGADPDHPKSADSLRQLIARTRRQLGRPTDGRQWIEHRGGGWYALHPDTRFDWADFRELSQRGTRESSRALLSAALALVRGEPFRDCDWWWLDQAFLQTVRNQIAETALILAELELTAGDGRTSAHAAQAGLGIDPADERLWRALMRAEHDAGRPDRVQNAWNACLAVLADIALDGQPHQDTAALHRELTACRCGDGVRMRVEQSLT